MSTPISVSLVGKGAATRNSDVWQGRLGIGELNNTCNSFLLRLDKCGFLKEISPDLDGAVRLLDLCEVRSSVAGEVCSKSKKKKM